MAKVRLQASINPATALARDAITNTIFLDTDELGTEPDYGALANDLATLYVTLASNIMPTGVGNVNVRAYNMGDALPRPIKGESTKALTGSGSFGPREVALCLSFHADRNLPRHRGRIYLGPFRSTLLSERPGSGMEPAIANFANGISGLGGINVQWVVHSRLDQAYRTVKRWWFDDEWDTVRSRGIKASKRTTATVNG